MPALTSDAGGLPEANPLRENVVETRLFWDAGTGDVYRGASHAGALRGEPGGVKAKQATPTAETAAFAARCGVDHDRALQAMFVADPGEVAAYERRLVALLKPGGALDGASDDAYAAADAYVASREGGLAAILDAPRPVARCDACAEPAATLKRCTKCRLVAYCSVACQRKHWPAHKPDCCLPLSKGPARLAPTK